MKGRSEILYQIIVSGGMYPVGKNNYGQVFFRVYFRFDDPPLAVVAVCENGIVKSYELEELFDYMRRRERDLILDLVFLSGRPFA